MELIFEKINEHRYEAYFEASGDFNLHVERIKNGTLEVYQRGVAEGKYDFAWSAGIGARKIIDYDFAAFVYPKWIKVVSSSEVVNASVNFNEGGGSGSGSDGSAIEYYRIDKSSPLIDEDYSRNTIMSASAYKCISDGNGNVSIFPGGSNDVGTLLCIAGAAMPYAVNGETIGGNESWLKNQKALLEYLNMPTELSFLIPITKEEFYNLERIEIVG